MTRTILQRRLVDVTDRLKRLRAELGRTLDLRFEVGEVPAPDEPARELVADVPSAELRASLERAISRTLRG